MGSQLELVNMVARLVFVSLSLFAGVTLCQDFKKHNLPVLFQYEEPGHSVAVFRGAELKQAIAAGLVPGFGNLGRKGKVLIDDGSDDMAAAKTAAAAKAAADATAAADARAAAEAKAAADARARAAAAKAAADARAAAEAKAAAEARARAAAAKAAADARAAEEARQARSRTSQLDSAEQACIQACKNLAGQCRNPFA